MASTAILPVQEMAAAEAFYTQLGLEVNLYDPGYAIVTLGGRELMHLEAREGTGSVYLNVPDVDAWHSRCTRLTHDVTSVENRSWGMREFTLTDPSGNTMRIGTNL